MERQKNTETNRRILAKGEYAGNDTFKTGLNNNDVIIGPSGAGKTRGYVIPNILQKNGSMVVADTKGTVKKQTERILKEDGYQILEIDFAGGKIETGYNPFDFIGYDRENDRYCGRDLKTVAAMLIPVKSRVDPYWEYAARQYFECLASYVLECLPRREQNLSSVVELFSLIGTGTLGRLFWELEELSPESYALSIYNMVKDIQRAERMHESIKGILSERLYAYREESVQKLFKAGRRVRFKDLGKKKTALFLNISDTDRSMDALVNLFYAQAFHELCDSADNDYEDGRLPVPVRFYLDDFAANVYIPDFDRITSVIRSREVSVSIILQSLSQLDGMYGEAGAKTILNNCDHCLYLGGQDVGTARYIGIKADRPASRILNMPLDEAWLFRRGSTPKKVEKYQLPQCTC